MKLAQSQWKEKRTLLLDMKNDMYVRKTELIIVLCHNSYPLHMLSMPTLTEDPNISFHYGH